MGFYGTIKKTLTDTVDAVVDKTTTQAQKSRLRLIMRNEAKLANDAYIELGKYFYNNLRNDASAELEDVCKRIDISRERMSRAQQRYRDVIQEELINKEITRNEVKENLQKIKEPIVAKAKDTADKVSDMKDAAVEKAAEIKEKIPKPKFEVGYGEIKNDGNETEIAIEIFENSADNLTEEPAESPKEMTVQEAIEQAVTEAVNASLNNESVADHPLHTEYEVDDNDEDEEKDEEEFSNEEAEPECEDTNDDTAVPNTIYSYSDDPLYETSSEEAASLPPSEPVNQEFQRTTPVDIIDEEEFEEEEPKAKKRTVPSIQLKARRLKEIIKGDNPENKDN